MYIIEVIPLIPLPPNTPQILSYFHDRQLVRGATVQVPLGSRKIQAVVISSAPLEEAKIAVKKSSFQLKKVASVVSEDPWVGAFQFQLAAWMSR
ncbi:MAG: hypothetical protein Q8P35_01995, partial [Candidatus Yanofskybacteria bacterium]|nr:hypothetical protein [Candidatus Yanofskybacteria bacterium]